MISLRIREARISENIYTHLKNESLDFWKPRVNLCQDIGEVSAQLVFVPKCLSGQCLVWVGVVLDQVPGGNHDQVVVRMENDVAVRLDELK